MSRPARPLLAAVTLGLVACAPISSRSRPEPAPGVFPFAAICDRLYFGRAIPSGGAVTDEQWNAFVATEIAPRFPLGFTLYRGDGHWRRDDGAPVREQTMVLEIVHAPGVAPDRALDDIVHAYCIRFRQDAVMRVRTAAEQSFLRR